MNSECVRIADQLRRAFTGDAWHGSPLRDLLSGVTSDQAQTRPLSSVHSIWELVLHIEVWIQIAFEATEGIAMPKPLAAEKDWPVVTEGSATAWSGATNHLFQRAEQLARAMEKFADARLQDIVPGREYDFYQLFHGIVQHSLYHGGPIAMLRKATLAT